MHGGRRVESKRSEGSKEIKSYKESMKGRVPLMIEEEDPVYNLELLALPT